MAMADGILYNFVFNYLWWAYMFHVLILMPDNLVYILLLNYILYFITNTVQFFIIMIMLYGSMRKKDYWLILFLPLMPLYTGFFLRIVRTYAQIMELFFKVSYDDKWNPWKVSKIAKEKGL